MSVEAKGFKAIKPWLDENYDFHLDTKRFPRSDLVQPVYGDFLLFNEWEACFAEMKVEQRYTRNFFIERWSNRKRRTDGWIWKLRCSLLLYVFLDVNRLYVINMPYLQKHAFNYWEPYWTERMQKKHQQLNDTWGWIVPVDHVMFVAGLMEVDLNQRKAIWSKDEHGKPRGIEELVTQP